MITRTDIREIPRIKHREAMQIATAENAKFAAALCDLRPDDWAAAYTRVPGDVEVMVDSPHLRDARKRTNAELSPSRSLSLATPA